MDHTHSSESSGPTKFWGSRYSVGLLVLGAVAAYFLLEEHRAHLLGALPYLLLLACPLMHVFMHRGHGKHGAASRHGDQSPSKAPVTPELSNRGERS